MIAYNIETRQFGWINNTFGPSGSRQGARMFRTGPEKDWRGNINRTSGVNVNGKLKTSWTTTNQGLSHATATLNKGGIADRLKWNTGGAANALGGGKQKLTFGSKARIGLTGAASGLAAGKIAKNIAQNRAQNQAVKAGLKPGTAEYDKFVKQKAQGAKTIGRIVGTAAGLAGARLLGKNTFKLK